MSEGKSQCFATVKEIAAATGKSERTIQRWGQGWAAETLNIRGDQRFELASLPPEIRERIIRHRYGVDDGCLETMVAGFELKVAPEKLKDPSVGMKIRMVCECLAVPGKVKGRRDRIKEIAEAHGYNVGTAYRLMKRVEKGKPLIKTTKNHGVSIGDLGITLRAWDEKSGRMAVEAIMENRRGAAEKLSLYNKVYAEASAQGLKCGTYRSFLTIAGRIDRALVTYRDKGVRGLREDVVPAIRRDHTAYRAMECLVGDQHKADYYAFDQAGDIATLELFCWLDFRTQLVWGSVAYRQRAFRMGAVA